MVLRLYASNPQATHLLTQLHLKYKKPSQGGAWACPSKPSSHHRTLVSKLNCKSNNTHGNLKDPTTHPSCSSADYHGIVSHSTVKHRPHASRTHPPSSLHMPYLYQSRPRSSLSDLDPRHDVLHFRQLGLVSFLRSASGRPLAWCDGWSCQRDQRR